MAEANLLLRIIGDESGGENALERMTNALRRYGRQKAEATADVETGKAQGKLATLTARLAALDARRVDVDVDVDTAGATAKIGLFRASLAALGGATISARSGLRGLTASAAGAGDGFGSAMKVGLGPFGAALNPLTAAALAVGAVIATSLVTSLLAVVASAGQATVAIGALAIGGFGALLSAVPLVVGAVKLFKEQADIAGSSANRLKVAAAGMGSAFRQAISPGSAAILRGLADALKALSPVVAALRPAFTSLGQDIARAIRLAANDVAGLDGKIATMVTRSGPLFRTLARAVGPLLEVLLNIANAALPHLTKMAGRVVDMFKRWEDATSGPKRMSDIMVGLVGHMRSWSRLLRDVGKLIGAVFGAIAPLGQSIVDSLASAARETTKWVKSAEGTAKVQQVFGDLAELASQVASGVGKMVAGFVNLSAAAAPAVGGLLTALRTIGEVLIASLGPAAEKVGELLRQIVTAIEPALPFFQNVVGPLLKGVLDGLILALQPLIWGLEKFAELLGWVGEKAEGARPFIEGVGKVIGFLFSGAILGAVGGILRGIGMGFGLIGRMAQGAGKILSWIGGLVKGLLSGPLRGLRAIGGKIGEGFSKLGGVAKTVWGGIKSFVGGAANGAKNIAIGAFNALKSRVTAVFNALKSAVSSVWGAIKSVVGGAASRAKDAVVRAFNALKDGAVRAFNGVKDGAARVFGKLREFIYDKVAAVGRAVRGLVTGFLNVGQALIQGLINGVKRMAGRVVDAVKNVVTGAKNAAKRLLGIGSPSKVFAGFGKDVGQGFANGITAMGSTVGKAIDRTMTGQIDAVGANLSAAVTGGVALPRGGLRAPAAASRSSVRHGDTYNVTVQGVPGTAPDDDALLAAVETKLRARGGLPSLA